MYELSATIYSLEKKANTICLKVKHSFGHWSLHGSDPKQFGFLGKID